MTYAGLSCSGRRTWRPLLWQFQNVKWNWQYIAYMYKNNNNTVRTNDGFKPLVMVEFYQRPRKILRSWASKNKGWKSKKQNFVMKWLTSCSCVGQHVLKISDSDWFISLSLTTHATDFSWHNTCVCMCVCVRAWLVVLTHQLYIDRSQHAEQVMCAHNFSSIDTSSYV